MKMVSKDVKGRAFRVSSSYSNKLISEHKEIGTRRRLAQGQQNLGNSCMNSQPHGRFSQVLTAVLLQTGEGVPGQCGQDAPWLYELTKDGCRSSLVG